jgi:hypothetical protein
VVQSVHVPSFGVPRVGVAAMPEPLGSTLAVPPPPPSFVTCQTPSADPVGDIRRVYTGGGAAASSEARRGTRQLLDRGDGGSGADAGDDGGSVTERELPRPAASLELAGPVGVGVPLPLPAPEPGTARWRSAPQPPGVAAGGVTRKRGWAHADKGGMAAVRAGKANPQRSQTKKGRAAQHSKAMKRLCESASQTSICAQSAVAVIGISEAGNIAYFSTRDDMGPGWLQPELQEFLEGLGKDQPREGP